MKNEYGRLTVLVRVGNDKYSHQRFLCKCECGNEKIILKNQLISGRTQSCGCLQREKAKMAQLKHGASGTKLHHVWKAIFSRCYSVNNKSYINYGGRGITACEEWSKENGFKNFRDWALTNGYQEGLTIERVDNNKGYSPNNCVWASHAVQANNKRNNINITIEGETRTISQWAKKMNKSDGVIRQRIKKLNWDPVRAVLEPKL